MCYEIYKHCYHYLDIIIDCLPSYSRSLFTLVPSMRGRDSPLHELGVSFVCVQLLLINIICRYDDKYISLEISEYIVHRHKRHKHRVKTWS